MKAFYRISLLLCLMAGSLWSSGQETVIYTSGFESGEEFTASTTYNNSTEAFFGPSAQQWGTFYGAASTTSPIAGSQSMQMRWYTSAIGSLGYTFMNFDLENVTKVEFSAKNTTGINVIATYSTDGGSNWQGAETFTLSTIAGTYTYNISATGEFANVRVRFQLAFDSQPGGTSRLYVDDVVVYGMSSADETAPTFIATYPNVSNIVADGFNLNVQLDEAGTYYYAILADGTTAPTSAAVKTGTGFVASGSAAVSADNTTVTSAIAGLNTGTVYDIYVVAEDDEGTPNLQASPVVIEDVTPTADVVAPILQSAATSTGTAQSIVLTFDEPVAATDATGFSLTINAVSATISDLSVDASTITLYIDEEIFVGDAVVLNYSAGNVQDLNGNALATLTDVAVTNNATTVLVTDLAALRSQSTGSTVYRVTGEIIFTYGFGNRNQKYFQDATAGILIDDTGGAISTSYVFGDGVTGLEGRLGTNAGVLQFVPTGDVGAPTSTGNVVTPVTVTAADFKAAINAYESQVIKIEALTFNDAGTQFSTFADNYTLTDGAAETIVFRDQYSEADYSSYEIPYGRLDVIGLASEFNGTAQVFPFSQTASVLDIYAPLYTSVPDVVSASFFQAEISARIDEQGTVYYLVLSDGATTPTNEEIKAGTSVVVTNPAAQSNITLEGLTDNTSYDVYVLAADDETVPNEQVSAVKVDVVTPELIVDATTDILAAASPIAGATLSSVTATPIDAFNFQISDLGTSDGFSTFVTGGVIVPGANNTAVWTSAIASATLTVNGSEIPTTVGAGSISFDTSGSPVEIADGNSAEWTLAITLSSTQTDGAIFEFEIPAAHSFTANAANGSTFPTDVTGVVSAQHTMDVVATALTLNVFEAAAILTDFRLSVSATDANGNADNAARIVSLSKTTGSGNLTSITGLSAQTMTDGTFTWSDLQLDAIGDYTVTVDDDGSALTVTSGSITGFEPAGDLFISEYIEGGSNNKAIEIYNNLGGPADLSLYSVEIYGNGSPTATGSLLLSDIKPTLATGEVLVIANSGSVAAILNVTDITSSVTFYNGDDALALLKNGSVIDVIGEIGNDPGTAWNVAGVTNATQNKTLVRKNTVTEGNPTNLASFGTNTEDSEWIVYNQDDFNFIGYHVFGEQPFPLITIDETGFDGNFGFVANGSSSLATSYMVITEDLTEDLVITPPVGFELSADENFTGTVYTNASAWSITPTDGVVSQTVYVRFTPPAADGNTYSGDITHTSTDASLKTVAVSGVEGAPSVSSLSGIVINEVLYDPNGTFNYDTDGSGAANTEDEFIEIFNTSASPVDISGWQLWDEGGSAIFTFPATTILGAGNYAAVMGPVQTGGTLPTPAVGNLAYTTAMSLSNGGENVALFDPNANQYVQVKYGATEADAAISGLSGATLVGIIEAWGVATAGSSLVRSPEGGIDIVIHADIQGAESASFAAPAIDPNAPRITIVESGLNFGNLDISSVSSNLTYTVSGANLLGDIVITTPTDFEVSTDGTNFSSSVMLTPSANTVTETIISVRFTASSFGSKDGVITHTSTDASTLEVETTGAGIDENTIAFVTFAGCDAAPFDGVSVVGAQVWRCAFTGETGNGYLMSGFASGAQDNEDWLIGSFDLTTYTGAELSFDSDLAFGGPALEVYASTDYAGNPATATWTALDALFDENTTAATWTNSGDISLIEFAGGMIHIGFKYVSNTTEAPQWVIDNVLLSETAPFLEVNSTSFNGDFGQQEVGTSSVATSFTVDGFGLTENVTITPALGFEVSTSAAFTTLGTSSAPLVLTPVDGFVDGQAVFARFSPASEGVASGNIVIASTGFTSINLAVSGLGEATTTGINPELGITIYPNPAVNYFTIDNQKGTQLKVEIYSLLGTRMAVPQTGRNYDISGLSDGVYVIVLKNAQNQQIGSQRIIKE